jgi:hypothetical protein
MSELITQLAAALMASGPNSNDAQQIRQQIRLQSPAEVNMADEMVKKWRDSSAAPPPQPASSNSDGPSLPWKSVTAVLAALGIGTGAGAGIDFKSLPAYFENVPLPFIGNRWELLGVVAAVGAIVGFLYSFYRNNWTIVMPAFSRSQQQFKVASWGFLRNVVMGATVAAATTWTAFSSMPATAAGGNLLTWTVLLSAVVAGIVGSRMTSGEAEKNVLWDALARSAENPAVPGLGPSVRNAKTPDLASKIVTGGAVKPAEIQADLLTLFDLPTLKALLQKLGKPLNQDADGLTIEPLEQFQAMKPALKEPLKNLEVRNVAVMTPEQFHGQVDRQGIDAARFKDLLTGVHGQAVRAMTNLAAWPKDLTLSADNLESLVASKH